jgi:hypothetical protein
MSNFKLKPAHASVKEYYATLERFGRGKFDHLGNFRLCPASAPGAGRQ